MSTEPGQLQVEAEQWLGREGWSPEEIERSMATYDPDQVLEHWDSRPIEPTKRTKN